VTVARDPEEERETSIELRRRLREVEAARDAAVRSSQAKSELLASVSHELRTPMTAILGYADLLRRQVESPASQELLATIRRNGEQLLAILNDVLDLSKIEAGELAVESLRVDPLGVVDEVVAMMRAPAEARGLELVVAHDSPLPSSIESDPLRVRQILLNLVSNAVKFTERGRVEIRVSTDVARQRLVLRVVDTGIGMSAERVATLFRPFDQGEASTARLFGGTGLGLVISRHLARRLGGDLVVSSVRGEGSVFEASIALGRAGDYAPRVTAAEAASSRPRVAPPASNLPPPMTGTALLVEDTDDVRRLMRAYLSTSGLAVTCAADGVQAVQEGLKALTGDAPFGVVFMDMHMPRMDGYEATAKLRAAGYTRPIVALTASAMIGDRERCLAAGCDDYLAKPVTRAALLACALRHLRRDEAAGAPLVSTIGHDASTLDVLEGFVRALPERVEAVAAATAAGDATRAQRLTHQLRGAAGSFGFPAIFDAGTRLEAALVKGEAADRTLSELRDLARRARARSA
jgi:CheY-like chemotaxis protein/nitrogen-specific signal transduction histidine kinase